MAGDERSSGATATEPVVEAPQLPPQTSADELLADLNKIPLFMTELEDGPDANPDLEALKALAYEGTRADVAENFKTQGNDCVKAKRWADAREFYGKALAVLTGHVEGVKGALELGGGPVVGDEDDRPVIDVEEEARREKVLEEQILVNRALCNLELKNYGSVTRDCASALRLNPNNTKALYRSALACFSLSKFPAAADACARAARLDPENSSITSLRDRIASRQAAAAKAEEARRERERREKQEQQALAVALKAREIRLVGPKEAGSDMDDARIALEDPLDPASVLRLPVLLVYPLTAQTDLLKAVREIDTMGDWLSQVLPAPWDNDPKEYTVAGVDCFMETANGGLVKAGKKVLLGKVLKEGKVDINHGIVRCYVVPKGKAKEWIAEFKRRKAK